jgi:hypothetical protein
MSLSSPSVLTEQVMARRWIIAQDTARAADLRAQEVDEVTDRLRILQERRGVDPVVLAAAVAEQAARTRLSDQARRNADAAHDMLTNHRLLRV